MYLWCFYLDALLYVVLNIGLVSTCSSTFSSIGGALSPWVILNGNECHWARALLSWGCGEKLETDQGSGWPGFPYVCMFVSIPTVAKSEKYQSVVWLGRHAGQGSVWPSRPKHSSFLVQPKGTKINHLHKRQKSARVTIFLYVRTLSRLIIPLFLAGRSILSFWRHRSLVIEPRHGRLLWAGGGVLKVGSG